MKTLFAVLLMTGSLMARDWTKEIEQSAAENAADTRARYDRTINDINHMGDSVDAQQRVKDQNNAIIAASLGNDNGGRPVTSNPVR